MSVTVLMPVKEPHDTYFIEALESVVNQSSPEWRLIIIGEGDCSTIKKMLGEYEADKRISIVANASKLITGALNTGMRVAETEFFSTLCGDDMITLDAVSTLLKHIG